MDITTKLTESKELQLTLDAQRDVYRPLGAQGSTMFFIIKGLTRMDHMYHLRQINIEIVFTRLLK